MTKKAEEKKIQVKITARSGKGEEGTCECGQFLVKTPGAHLSTEEGRTFPGLVVDGKCPKCGSTVEFIEA